GDGNVVAELQFGGAAAGLDACHLAAGGNRRGNTGAGAVGGSDGQGIGATGMAGAVAVGAVPGQAVRAFAGVAGAAPDHIAIRIGDGELGRGGVAAQCVGPVGRAILQGG